MRRSAVLLVCCAAALSTSTTEAANQITRWTRNGATYDMEIRITVGGVQSAWLPLSDNLHTTLATVQASLNGTYGAGKMTVTWPTANAMAIEFVGSYANTAVTVTTVARGYDVEGATFTSTAFTQSNTQTATSGGGGGTTTPTPASDEKLAELLAAINTTNAKLDTLNTTTAGINSRLDADAAEQSRHTFLLQVLSQTMGLICGGMLWRTIILAKNQTRFW